jgi:hypothetical protein
MLLRSRCSCRARPPVEAPTGLCDGQKICRLEPAWSTPTVICPTRLGRKVYAAVMLPSVRFSRDRSWIWRLSATGLRTESEPTPIS